MRPQEGRTHHTNTRRHSTAPHDTHQAQHHIPSLQAQEQQDCFEIKVTPIHDVALERIKSQCHTSAASGSWLSHSMPPATHQKYIAGGRHLTTLTEQFQKIIELPMKVATNLPATHSRITTGHTQPRHAETLTDTGARTRRSVGSSTRMSITWKIANTVNAWRGSHAHARGRTVLHNPRISRSVGSFPSRNPASSISTDIVQTLHRPKQITSS